MYDSSYKKLNDKYKTLALQHLLVCIAQLTPLGDQTWGDRKLTFSQKHVFSGFRWLCELCHTSSLTIWQSCILSFLFMLILAVFLFHFLSYSQNVCLFISPLSGHVFMFWDSFLKLSRDVSFSNCMVGMQLGTIADSFGLWFQMRWCRARTYSSSSNNSSNHSSTCPQRPAPSAWTLSPPALDITARVTPLSLVSAAPVYSCMTSGPQCNTVV